MTSFPTTLVPDDISAVTTKLGDLSKSHTDHHQAVDERLGELQAALGKIDLTGFARNGPTPTIFDPGVANWDDSAFLSIFYDHTGDNQSEEWTWGSADGSANFLRLLLGTATASRQTSWTAESDSDSGNEYVIANMNASINRADGTGRQAYYHVETDLGGEANIWADDDGAYLQAIGNAGQTDPLLDLQDSTAHATWTVVNTADHVINGVRVETPDTAHYATLNYNVGLNHNDGTSQFVDITGTGELVGVFKLRAGFDATLLQLVATPGQSASILDIEDENGNPLLEMTQTTLALWGGTGSGQFAAIADSTAVTVSARFNDLLAYLRLRGDIAT